jgi:hypothetical protein
MALDAYSLCPGGSGKKIKFCCNDMLPELEKLDRMLEGQQFHAALQHIERLEPNYGDRACLLAIKSMVQRILDKTDEAQATATKFLEKHPHNPIALAESAILTAGADGGRAAIGLLQRAISASSQQLEARVYEAIRVVGAVLAAEGEFLPARALAMLQTALNREDSQAMELMVRLNTHTNVPALMKSERRLAEAPAGAPWKAAFDEAMLKIRGARWAEGAEGLATLTQEHPDVPAIWRNLSIVRGWLGDTAGTVAALEKYASLDVPLEDAVEATALARLLSEDPLGDEIDLLDLNYTVNDVEQLQVAMASSPRATAAPMDPRAFARENEPPPRAVFLLFDRPSPDASQPLEPDSIPRLLCHALLHGRQTDREPWLEVIGISRQDLDQLNALLAELSAGQLGSPSNETVAGRISASQELLSHNWRFPDGTTQEDAQRLSDQHLERAVLGRWPQTPLGLLDGKTPQAVDNQPAYRIKVLAAILILDHWLEQQGGRVELNRLRTQLGLPTLDPIDPAQVDVRDLSLVRLSRLTVDKLTDDQLLSVYHRAMAFNARNATTTFARALVDRPSMVGREEQFHAYMILARTAEQPDKAIEYVNRGRQAAEGAGQSSAPWDLLELSFRFQRGEGAEAVRLIEHLQRQHIREPGVAQALSDLLIQVGVMRPDGTFAAPMGPAAEEQPGIMVPGAEAAEPGKLWTPEGQTPQGEKPKLWMPGMD